MIDGTGRPWVLLVEDDQGTIFLFKQMLRGTGLDMSITVAEDARKAMEVLSRSTGSGRNIDLVLLKLDLPQVDGLEVLSFMRSMHGLKQVPVIAFKGSPNSDDEARAIGVGASSFIIKPSNHREFQALVGMIKRLLTHADI
jgi:CheY-like chemotaxis protein